MGFLEALAEASILHFVIALLSRALIICLLIRMVLSWILRGQENGFSRFFNNVTDPVVRPFDKVLPPIAIGGVSLSLGFIVAWFAVIMVAALLSQALPQGW
ncbi:MAG TPA: YggT family protein [Ktedonobacterales bacterium]|nr:YggT family protein [Ktedonobacterales bacterium]